MTDAQQAVCAAEETCPCKWCTKSTPMLGTKMCDACWELDHRIRSNPALARRILDTYAPPSEASLVANLRQQLRARM